MDSDVPLLGRPYGGCCILWHKHLAGTVTPIDTNSKRFSCVLYDTGTVKILMFCVYMPSDKMKCAEYDEVLENISQICNSHENTMIVIGGDFNTSFSRTKEPRTRKLVNYIRDENFKCCLESILSDIDYTYESKINGDRSLIDHICISDNIFHAINEYKVLHHSNNLSDHSAVILSLDIDDDYVCIQSGNANSDVINAVDA